MADNTSLFGGMMSPEEMQQQLIEQRALQFANLNQNQRLAMMGYKAGAGVGNAVGGLFGADMTDPTIQRATKLREMASQYNTNTASGLRQMAAAVQATDPDTAYKILQQANALEMNEAKLNTERATAIAKLREKQALDPFQKLLETGKYTPESMAKYQESGNVQDLQFADKEDKISFGAEAERISKAMFGTEFKKLNPEQAKKVNEEVFRLDATLKATGAPKQTVINAQETSFAKERGTLQAKSLAEAETQAKASANAVNRLASMEKLNQGSMITGPLAGSAIGAGQFLSSLGLLSPDSAKTLSTSEVYDKLAKDLVMQDLGGKLGAQISDADRQFIEARIPQLRNSQQARTELIGKLKEIHKKNIDYYQRMSKHATAKGNLNDFDFASSAPDNTPALGTKENPIKLQ